MQTLVYNYPFTVFLLYLPKHTNKDGRAHGCKLGDAGRQMVYLGQNIETEIPLRKCPYKCSLPTPIAKFCKKSTVMPFIAKIWVVFGRKTLKFVSIWWSIVITMCTQLCNVWY